MNKVLGVIPARFESSRFPGKMLQDIHGKPLIQLVFENAKKANRLADLIVASDHQGILNSVSSFGGKGILTDSKHPSGTDRIIEVIQDIECDVVVNIQGDEPFLDPKAIDSLIDAFDEDESLEVATLCYETRSREIYADPNVVKVVFDSEGYALYFSRSPIPYYREKTNEPLCYKHFGVYAYRRDFLIRFGQLETSTLENAEKLEQLRILENGTKIKVLISASDSLGVDTPEDLELAKKIYQQRVGK